MLLKAQFDCRSSNGQFVQKVRQSDSAPPDEIKNLINNVRGNVHPKQGMWLIDQRMSDLQKTGLGEYICDGFPVEILADDDQPAVHDLLLKRHASDIRE